MGTARGRGLGESLAARETLALASLHRAEVDPTLEADLQAAAERSRQGPPNNPAADRDVALLQMRVEYESAKIQASSAADMKTSTGRLVTATWVLAGATVALVLSTIVLIVLTAGD